MANVPSPNHGAVGDYIDTLSDEQTVADTLTMIDVMRAISGHEPALWHIGSIGFDTYHFKYDSGREGDSHVLGFYPRKDKLTFYLMDGTERHAEQLARLGKYTRSKACLYIKRLSDIDQSVLEAILRDSYKYVKKHIHHVAL
jgi:hypothetical protein